MDYRFIKMALTLVAVSLNVSVLHCVAAPAKQGSAALNPAYKAYTDRVCRKVDQHWLLADGKNHVVLSVNVGPDGTVTDLKMSSTPSDTAAEQAANDAFNQAQPLDGLPAGSPAVRLTITFDSSADPHGDNTHSISAKLDALAAPKPEDEPPTPPAESN